MPTSPRLPFVCAAAAFLLAACGGGGGGTSPTSATTVPLEGFYQGNTSNKETLQALVLENGDFWGVVIPTANTSGAPSSLLQGSGSSSANLVQNNNIYTVGSLLQINNGQVTTTGSITASYVPRVSMQGTITLSGTSSTFSDSALAATSYNYDTAASVSTLVGTWTGIAFDGSSATLAVDGSTGAFSIPGNSNCTLSGTLSARASGKNVYDVAAQYVTTPTDNTVGGATCSRAGLAVKGFAVSYAVAGAKQQIVLATLDAGQKVASYFTASR